MAASHATPAEKETAKEHSTRVMISMVDMVKFELTKGDVLSFEGNPHMVAAGVLFAKKIESLNSTFQLIINKPSGGDLSDISSEILQSAQKLIDSMDTTKLQNEPFFEKIQSYQNSLQISTPSPT